MLQYLYLQELTAAEEEQVEEDKEKQHQVSHKLLFVYSSTRIHPLMLWSLVNSITVSKP